MELRTCCWMWALLLAVDITTVNIMMETKARPMARAWIAACQGERDEVILRRRQIELAGNGEAAGAERVPKLLFAPPELGAGPRKSK
ncbi:hypothetical protein [Sorangium sp. So ce341]|uniref:hypothetical protein n=1 Tax=Sorangium sp. So ce341 TaxID=3133302 RepID=UPI003F619A4E